MGNSWTICMVWQYIWLLCFPCRGPHNDPINPTTATIYSLYRNSLFSYIFQEALMINYIKLSKNNVEKLCSFYVTRPDVIFVIKSITSSACVKFLFGNMLCLYHSSFGKIPSSKPMKSEPASSTLGYHLNFGIKNAELSY